MRSGKLDRLIEVQRSIVTLNDVGTPAETWSTIATLRAELVQLGTVEAIRQHGAVDTTDVVFRTRFLAGVTLADRVVFEGRALNLKAVTPIGRNRGLELRAEALA